MAAFHLEQYQRAHTRKKEHKQRESERYVDREGRSGEKLRKTDEIEIHIVPVGPSGQKFNGSYEENEVDRREYKGTRQPQVIEYIDREIQYRDRVQEPCGQPLAQPLGVRKPAEDKRGREKNQREDVQGACGRDSQKTRRDQAIGSELEITREAHSSSK